MSPARKRRRRRARASAASRRRPHIHTVSFDSGEDEWVDALVHALRSQGLPNAARSQIVRVALRALRDALAKQTGQEVARFFIRREADRLLANLDATADLPFD